MKLVAALLISTVVGIVPALAQSTSTTTSTTAATPDGNKTTTTWSDGSSATTTTSGSTSTTTYQPPGSGYQGMGSSGYNPMGGPGEKEHKSRGGGEVTFDSEGHKTRYTDVPTDAAIAQAIHDEHVCAPVKLYLDRGVVYQRAEGCRP
jgi:hypothetical protein